jgi:hypothetical protein
MKKKRYTLLMNILLILLTGASSMNAQSILEDPFFEKVDFVGAFGAYDWTTGWANWTPQWTEYPTTTVTISAGDISSNSTWSPGSPLMGVADFTHSKLNHSFFDIVDYVGAFGSINWTEGWTNWNPQATDYPTVTEVIPAGDITASTTLTSDKVYLLDGWVYVKTGATLTIEPGTVIRGSKANKGALIIEKGAKIIAEGTATEPIVFTSNQDAGSRTYGDWGGIILLGNATVNKVDPVIEGGPTSTYGGSNDADSSGVMKYVRIEFPGIAFQPDKEINGLTLGGVGSRTLLDYLQVSFCGDDSYEWFGGTVNAKHLVAFRGWDDDFDTDYGYRGMVQFAIALRDPEVADAGSGSNCFESDNDGSGSNATPITEAVFCNVSAFGPLATPSTTVNANYKRALHLRRNTQLSVFNSVFAGYVTGLLIDGAASQANATAGNLNIKNCILAGCKDYFGTDFDSLYFNEVPRSNIRFASHTEMSLADPFNLEGPNFMPVRTAYLLDGWVYLKDGATLTIEPGTVIRGSKSNKGALIVEKGGRLVAEGSASNPIVFTSNQDPGSRSYGDWGGIIVLGNATVNKINPVIEGGPSSTYGGTNDADQSGILKYIRIEFPGIAFQPDKEINGLTLGGVGSGTEIDFIQVSFCGDDSYEWFGGTVNAKHLIAFRGWDDDFDTDFGYRGKVQFAVSLRDPAVADAGSGSNSFESDNDGTGSDSAPFTEAVFSNISSFGPLVTPETMINSNFKRAMHLRRNTRLCIHNAIFAGYPTGLLIDGTAAQLNATSGYLNVQNTWIAGSRDFFATDFDSTFFMNPISANATLTNNDDLAIIDPFNLEAPQFLPESESPVLNASNWYQSAHTSISDYCADPKFQVRIYPNPLEECATLQMNLESLSTVHVKVYNLTGTLIYSRTYSQCPAGSHEFPVMLQKKGLYLADIMVNQLHQAIKLVVR